MKTPAAARCLVCALLLAAVPPAARGQIATLVQDLNQSPGGIPIQPPRAFHDLGGKAVFFADDGAGDLEPWVSDGTGPGTELLANAARGGGFGAVLGAGPRLVFWTAAGRGEDCALANRLWRTDGSRPGTFPLTDCEIEPGRFGLFALGRLFFFADEPGEQPALWVSDGTVAGTRRLVKLDYLYDHAEALHLTVLAGRVAFFNEDEIGPALWESDGTPAGTRVVERFLATPLFRFATSSTHAYFFAQGDFDLTEQLWVTDGTAAGTRPLTTFSVTAEARFEGPWVAGGRAYFGVRIRNGPAALWESGPEPASARRIAYLTDDRRLAFELSRPVAAVGPYVLFVLSSLDGGTELWRFDGRPDRLRRVREICPGPCDDVDRRHPLLEAGTRAYFVAQTEGGFFQLWTTNGNEAGTFALSLGGNPSVEVQDVFSLAGVPHFVARSEGSGFDLWTAQGAAPAVDRLTQFVSPFPFPSGSEFSGGAGFGTAGDRLYFAAYELTSNDWTGGLWTSDGTPQGTRLVTGLLASGFTADAQILWPRALGESLVFSACDGQLAHLYRAGGALAGLETLTPGRPLGSCPGNPVEAAVLAAGRELLLAGGSLWVTDGTAGGTFNLSEATTLPGFLGFRTQLAGAGDRFFVLETGPFVDQPLWVTDGTPAGTLEVPAPPEPAIPTGVVGGHAGALYFTVFEPEHGEQLWRADGTPGGTELLIELDGERTIPFARRRAALDGELYFLVEESFRDTELWKTDGTPGGTVRVKDQLGSSTNDPWDMVVFGDRLYFVVDLGGSLRRLWTSDGSEAGTFVVRTFETQDHFVAHPDDPDLTVVGDRLYLMSETRAAGSELWQSDGTFEGTFLVEDIVPGSASSGPSNLTAVGDRLFFFADDGVHGRELWQSDGTPAGTRLLHDIVSGPGGTQPFDTTAAGLRLFFDANDHITGQELWSFDLTADPDLCPPSDHGLCVQDDRFRVEIAWRTPQGLTGFGQPVPLTADTGYFWFFNPANVESIVKVLDGRGVNGHFWTFYGALSNVEYVVTVTDAATGLTRRYLNAPGQLASVGDTTSFGPLGASLERYTPPAEDLAASFQPRIESRFTREASGTCAPASNRLCLNGGRFAVEASWRDFAGNTGTGTAVPLTADTGYFWFFRDTNVEVVLKVLDGRPVNGHFWTFYGALSNVEYTLTVTDTATGAVRTYFNPARQFASVADTAAF